MAYLAPPPPLEAEYGAGRPGHEDDAPPGGMPLGGAPSVSAGVLAGVPAGARLGVYPITYDQPTAPPPAVDDAACASVPYEITMCLPPGAMATGEQLNHSERSLEWVKANLRLGQIVVLLLGPGLRLVGVVPVTTDVGGMLRQITLVPVHALIVAGRARNYAMREAIEPIAAMLQLPVLDYVFTDEAG